MCKTTAACNVWDGVANVETILYVNVAQELARSGQRENVIPTVFVKGLPYSSIVLYVIVCSVVIDETDVVVA